jgi:hypothetical protein
MLGIVIWLDGENIEITGILDSRIVLTPSLKSLPPLQTRRSLVKINIPFGEGVRGVR